MPHYVTLLRYTAQGMAKIKESPARLDAARKAADAAGGKSPQVGFIHKQIEAFEADFDGRGEGGIGAVYSVAHRAASGNATGCDPPGVSRR